MDIIRLLNDFNVPFATEGEKHTAPGWANMNCPFCVGSSGLHLGFNIQDEYFTCYRCGWKPMLKTVATLISVSTHEAGIILQRYGINTTVVRSAVKTQEKPLILPSGVSPLTTAHKKYLTGRGFDADDIEQKWKLQSTGPISQIDGSPYKHRILFPYMWNGQMVTFDTRDVTDKATEKYKACPKEREVLHRKSILYGNQEAWTDGVGICVEGPTDVWRFGEKSFAVSGISFTPAQVREIAKVFKVVFIVFDGKSETSQELQAQQQARKLRGELKFRGVKTEIVPLNLGDPGAMVQRKADQFVKNLLS
jgi:hypothetical protein